MLTEAEVRQAALDGLRSQIRAMLGERRYGPGQRLEAVVTKVLEDSVPLVEQQLTKALLEALRSPEFVAGLRAEMTAALRNKFAGAFAGVMHAAGKRAAQNRVLVESIAETLAASVEK